MCDNKNKAVYEMPKCYHVIPVTDSTSLQLLEKFRIIKAGNLAQEVR